KGDHPMQLVQIVWLVLLLLFVILEAATSAIVSIWFCAGAIAALLVSLFFPTAILAQVLVFVVVSGVALLAFRPLVRKITGNRRVPTNADANIGKLAQVVTEIQPARFGRVKLEGLEWTAKSDVVLPVGAWCRVDAIEGAKLVVSPLPPPDATTPPPAQGG
ncbi:NfeD family protein, partial [Ruminococcaceae bacterium OttesenSCG-928-O06]|nr:NfeD family protein [Ruminococcaceae bacterium OttesenSCG-928-O06]